ncbi:MAG: efflux transporter outer membrane subunit [Alphaproteobacteria bacterium]|nr:efflux transporter outer membrane subunit [Alphaproteobacteria bacterium]
MRNRIGGIAAALALLGGCSLAPDFRLPDFEMPAWWGNAAEEPPPPGAETLAPPPAWWKAFGLAELDALEKTALENNHDLKAAVARIRQAEAQFAIAGGPLLPSVSVSASDEVLRSASSTRTSSTRSKTGVAYHSYQGSVSASYELDFWGKNRGAVDAARATLHASEFDRDTVALTLTANVAAAWFQALALADRVTTARRNLEIARQSLELAEKQEQFGKVSGLEAAQQRSAVALIEAQVPTLELQRQQALDGLAILCGLPPSRIRLQRTTLADLSIPGVAPGLPASLLLRRPDIRRAEANLRAANANIGVARAQMFPSISLTADRGYSSAHLSSLLEPRSVFWTLGGSLTATIFDHGRLAANVRLSEAKKQELVEAYKATILAALRDVEDGLAAARFLAEQEGSQAVAVVSARDAQRLADIRYREGAVDYLTVLEAQRTLLQAEDGAVQTRLARFNAAIGLYKALGGGTGF